MSLFILCVFNDTLHHYAPIRHIIPHISAIFPSYFRRISCVYPVYILAYILCISGTQSVLHLRSNFTFGTILPPIIEQVLCPRSPLLFTFLLHSISFHNLMFEKFIIQCILMHQSGTQSVLHPRSNFTFGTILPPIIEQVLCLRSPLLFPFLLLYNLMFERFMHCVFYDTSHKSLEHPYYILHFYSFILHHSAFIRHSSGVHPRVHPHVHPAPYPFYIRGRILPSVRSYRRL